MNIIIKNSNVNSIEVRALRERDAEIVKILDNLSGFELSSWVADTTEEDSPYAWGLFVNGELAGYCSIGYADDVGDAIEKHPLHNIDSLLLSDVYIVPKFRHQGLAKNLIKSAIHKRWNLDKTKEAVFLVCVNDKVEKLYKKWVTEISG